MPEAVHPVTSASGIRRAGLSLVPFAAVVFTVTAAIAYAVTIPSSSPPSQDDVTSAAILMWVLSITCLVVSAVWASTVSTRIRRAVAVGIALCLVAAGWWVSGVLDRVWRDACDFGTGSGGRCIAGGGAPGWVRLVWPTFGLLIGGLCAGVAAIARHSEAHSCRSARWTFSSGEWHAAGRGEG